ncbi:hypothetical protein EZV73_05150 [Acidaminobacter sp. JC074]|uniref:alpha/beta hydrolase family protein n=1 Tax=Acidaminobacter sp. JC074 TaxID=2530199 RepID=UPI001F105316|nr:hypothetical protein [Acidaminobacter sp. JC074]MCH4886942.1 hypothetical protein [Acidaminobacter sp. JC074]
MSLFVFLLWILSCVNIFRIVVLKRPGKEMIGWFIFQLITTILQIRFDGITWRIALLYGLPLIWFLHNKTNFKKLMALLMVTLFVMTSLIVVVFSTPTIEAPSGRYVVGTTTMYLIDEIRDRELPVHIYYPSENSQGKSPEKWFRSESMVEGFADFYEMPDFILSQLNDVTTNSYKDIEVIEGELPVVIVSHGWGSFSALHVNLLELLASYGYIVVAPDHTEIATVSMLHTGQVVLCNRELIRDDYLLSDGLDVIDMYEKDLEFIIERLDYLNDHHKILYHHLDLDKLALIGHSTGGGAQVSYVMENPVSLLIGMDAWLEPLEKVRPLETESIFMRSSQWADYGNDSNLRVLTDKVYEPKGSRHQDFTMAYKISPALRVIGYTSSGSRQAVEESILSHLERYLMNRERSIKKKIPLKELR